MLSQAILSSLQKIVGLLKKDYLHYSKSETEINLMRSVKNIFDPNGILNPGKLFNRAET